MAKAKGFESYPTWIVLIYNLVFLSVYFVGLYLLYLIWPPLTILFFIYLLYLEFSVYREGCRYCYYYGKICGGGKGKLAPLFFKKGDSKKFCEKTLSFKDFIPQMLVSLVPLVAGAYLLVSNLNLVIFLLTIWPIIIWFCGNPIIYGKLVCPHCKQGQICCPAAEFFMKKEKKQRR